MSISTACARLSQKLQAAVEEPMTKLPYAGRRAEGLMLDRRRHQRPASG
jgi:fructose-1,6-bisphosphatase/inositol monophosphatase family enzyme